ncbi:PEGA domain-containing protein, partial [Bdellovibrionota bacterium FG-2]
MTNPAFLRTFRYRAAVFFCGVLFVSFLCHAEEPSLKRVVFIAPVEVPKDLVNEENQALLTNVVREAYLNSGKNVVVSVDDANVRKQVQKFNESCTSVEECILKQADAKAAEQYVRTQVLCPSTSSCVLTMTLKDINQNTVIKTESIKTEKGDVEFFANRLKTLCFAMLTEKTAAVGRGRMRAIIVRTNPPGAEVEIDNDPVGKTPWTGNVSVGQHTLLLIPGSSKFASFSESIAVFDGGAAIVFDRTLAVNTAQVQLEVKPAGALVLLDGQPFSRTEFRLPLQESKIATVSFQGFATKTVKIGPYEEARKYIEKVELAALPAEVRIVTNPPEVTVFLDGKEMGTSGLKGWRHELLHGQHQFKFSKIGFRSATETFIFGPGEKFTRTEPPVWATIESDPSGAKIFIDNREKSTPFKEQLPPGTYKISLEKNGYHALSKEIQIRRESDFFERVNLEPVIPKKKYSLLSLPLIFIVPEFGYT